MKKSAHIKVDYAFCAFVTLLVIAGWGVVMLWMHMTTVAGATEGEITFLATLVIMLWVLMPVYWKKIQWGYLAGMIVVASGFFGGGIASVLLHRIYFAWSFYNLSVIMVYVVVVIHVYASYRCCENLLPGSKKKTICGVGGIIFLMIVIAGMCSYYSGVLYWKYMYNLTLRTIDEELETMETLDEKIQYLMEKGDIPSLVAGIVVKDQVVWAKAYGDYDLDTVYAIGSITKPITATAVLQLCEKGLLDLDTDINEYLPFDVRHPQYPDTPVTVRMLLQHQSGLGRNISQHEQYMDGVPLRDWAAEHVGLLYEDAPSLGNFLKELVTPGGAYYTSDVWVDSPPGTGYTYSNLGYDLLGYLVEHITNTPFSVYVEQYIFDPLGMDQTGAYTADFEENALPHERFYGLFSKSIVTLPVYDRTYIGAGGIKTTVFDLAQFLIAHMNNGEHPNGYQLLTAESTALMHEQAVSVFNQFLMVGYGMGWEHRSNEPTLYYAFNGSQGHDGGTEGYTCHMWMVEREDSYGILVMTNVYHYYKPDPLWMIAWSSMVQDVLFHEASLMAAESEKFLHTQIL